MSKVCGSFGHLRRAAASLTPKEEMKQESPTARDRDDTLPMVPGNFDAISKEIEEKEVPPIEEAPVALCLNSRLFWVVVVWLRCVILLNLVYR